MNYNEIQLLKLLHSQGKHIIWISNDNDVRLITRFDSDYGDTGMGLCVAYLSGGNITNDMIFLHKFPLSQFKVSEDIKA